MVFLNQDETSIIFASAQNKFGKIWRTRPGVDKVKPKVEFKYSL